MVGTMLLHNAVATTTDASTLMCLISVGYNLKLHVVVFLFCFIEDVICY